MPRPQPYGHFYSRMDQIGQMEAYLLIFVSSFLYQRKDRQNAGHLFQARCSVHLYLLLKGMQHSCSSRGETVPSLWWNSKLNKGYIIKCCPWTRGRAANWPTNRMQVFLVGLLIETGDESVHLYIQSMVMTRPLSFSVITGKYSDM